MNKRLVEILIIAGGIVSSILLWEHVTAIIATVLAFIFGIEKASSHKKKAAEAQIEAEAYKEQADTRIIEAAKEAAEVNRKVQSAVDLASKQTEPVPEDDKYKRKSIKSW